MIGVAGPFSGPRSAYGALLKEAVGRAARTMRWDPSGFLFLDDRAEPAMARSAAEAFIRESVTGVIGHFNSQCAQSVAELYHRARIPVFLPASTASAIPREGEGFVVRMCGDNRGQCSLILDWLRRKGIGKAAIRCDASGYARELESLLRSDPGAMAQLQDGAGSGLSPDIGAVVLLGSHNHCLAACRELASEGFRGAVVGCDDCSIGEYADAVADLGLEAHHVEPVPGFTALCELAAALLIESDQSGRPVRRDIARGGWTMAVSRRIPMRETIGG